MKGLCGYYGLSEINQEKLYFPHMWQFRAMELSNVRQLVNATQATFLCLILDNLLFIISSSYSDSDKPGVPFGYLLNSLESQVDN